MNYDETMRYGEGQYLDVIQALANTGLRASFTQTGGMNGAIEAVLDGGAYLLVTDAEESLAWERSQHTGWAVGLYQDIEGRDEPLAYQSSEDGDVETLIELVLQVLRDGRGLAN